PLEFDGKRPIDDVYPTDVKDVVEVGKVQKQIAPGDRHVRNLEQWHQDEVCGQDADGDGRHVRGIKPDVALQHEAPVIAKDVLGAVQAPGDDESGDDKKDVDAKIPVFAAWAEEFPLSGYEMPPCHG